MNHWLNKTLDEICTKVTDGTHDSPKPIFSGGYPLIKGKDISKGYIDFGNCDLISDKDHLEVIKRSKPEYGDILFANIGNSIGDCVYISTTKEFSIKNVALFKPDQKIINPKFLFYTVKSSQFQGEIWNKISGAAQPFASLQLLRKHIIKLPPLPTQKKIAKILSNYDDLIENNIKRIKLLEESARLTYEEWFLRFRVDGEKLEIDSETGLPFGWQKRKLKDLTRYVARGISPKYVDEKGIIVLNQKCIRDNFVNIDLGRLHSLDKKVSQEKKLQFGDVLINSTGTGTLGRVAQIFEIIEGMTVDSHVSIVRANEMISPYILGRTLEYLEEYITNLGKGATNQQELGRSDLESLVKVVVPAKNHQMKYDEYASPIFKVINNLRKENRLLKEARDILLPRLMTGMIDVENMEVAV